MLKRILIVLVILTATLIYSNYQKNIIQSQLSFRQEEVLAKMPRTFFETLNGKPFGIHDVYEGTKVGLVVLHFWGTWCGPCEAELPELLNFINRFEGRTDVKFILIAVNDKKYEIEKHLKRLTLPQRQILWLMDNKNVHRDVFGTTRVPETYVFSSDMILLRKYTGPQDWGKALFFQTFDDFLKPSVNKL